MNPYHHYFEAIERLTSQRDELQRALKVIALGEAENPQAQAAEELIALGYWRDIPEARIPIKKGKGECDYDDKADDVADDFRMDELVTALQGRVEALYQVLAEVKTLADAAHRYDWAWALERIGAIAGAALDREEGVSDE